MGSIFWVCLCFWGPFKIVSWRVTKPLLLWEVQFYLPFPRFCTIILILSLQFKLCFSYFTVYICYTGVVAAMYFRNKAASELANSDNINNNNNNNGILSPSSSPRSPTRRSIHHEFSMDEDVDEHEALLTNQDTSTLTTTAASPIRKHNVVPIQSIQNTTHMENSPANFAFFPTLSRCSSTDLTRNRKGKVAVSGTVSSGIRSSDSSTRMSELVRSVELTELRNSPTSVSISKNITNKSNNNSTLNIESGECSDNDIESAGLLVDDIQNVDVNTDTSNVDVHSAQHILSFLISGIYVPVEHVIRALLPALHPQIPHFIAGNHATSTQRNPAVASTRVPLLRAVLVLASSILTIGVLAVCIVLFCESVIKRLGFDSTTMGATLVALGAEVCVVLLHHFFRATSFLFVYSQIDFWLFINIQIGSVICLISITLHSFRSPYSSSSNIYHLHILFFPLDPRHSECCSYGQKWLLRWRHRRGYRESGAYLL